MQKNFRFATALERTFRKHTEHGQNDFTIVTLFMCIQLTDHTLASYSSSVNFHSECKKPLECVHIDVATAGSFYFLGVAEQKNR